MGYISQLEKNEILNINGSQILLYICIIKDLLMSKIKIRNFGPIKKGLIDNEGWIDIDKVTVFIGNQGSGKSTVAKLISTFTWIEKALIRGDYSEKWFERNGRLRNTFLKYHRLDNYIEPSNGLSDNSEIEYFGKAYKICFKKGSLSVTKLETNNYSLPQIMYVPAERNFISYVKSPKELRLSSDSLKEFLTEFDNAKKEINRIKRLPINNVNIEYDRLNDIINIKGENYKVKLTDSSSGFQSLVPLFIVSEYLANTVKKNSENRDSMSTKEMNRFKKEAEDILTNDNLTDEQKRIAISILSKKFNKTAFINIVEEPEQNLFPTSQWKVLLELLKFNNKNIGNKLILTTHSPYIINYLSIAIEANFVKNKIPRNNKMLYDKLENIIPINSIINSDDVAIYELNEKDGSIKKLKKYEGIPSDRNLLNYSLEMSNKIFNQLLEIDQEI